MVELRVQKTNIQNNSMTPHLLQGWNNLQKDISNSLNVGTDAQDASRNTHQRQGTHTGWGRAPARYPRRKGSAF